MFIIYNQKYHKSYQKNIRSEKIDFLTYIYKISLLFYKEYMHVYAYVCIRKIFPSDFEL